MTWFCTLLKIGCTAATISGHTWVYDGDTIYVDHQAIRLSGVDAEELSEPHGLGARDALREIVGTADIICHIDGSNRGRKVARCYIGDREINGLVIASGWALDCSRYSRGRYRQLELPGARARLIQKGYC